VDMHWGSEYQDVQPWQKTAAREFINAGADPVVGQHSHMLNGIELYKGKYIVYSLGNFAFGKSAFLYFLSNFSRQRA
jgi:poly-gamma-glutamate capsule biosynthesis protein CapA/YwtB (metallophosphatase superfamily)